MVCKVCGRTMTNEEANFCEYCGASFRGDVEHSFSVNHTENGTGTYENQQTIGMSNGQNMSWREKISSGMATGKAEDGISFGQWLVIMILPFVPLVGLWAFIALLFVWGFGKNTPKTKKNWARATLVIGVFLIILMVVFMGQMISDPTYASLFEGILPQ